MVYLDFYVFGYNDVFMSYYFNIIMCYVMDNGIFNVIYYIDGLLILIYIRQYDDTI